MGLFTNTEKKIADAINQSLTKSKADIKSAEDFVITELNKAEQVLSADVKVTFDAARKEAIAANELVNKLKADLQSALIKARDLHQTAVDAAIAAQQAAEADVAKFKAMAAAHAADLATQASQIVTPPGIPANTDLSSNSNATNVTPDAQ